jgi:hypothetical protein
MSDKQHPQTASPADSMHQKVMSADEVESVPLFPNLSREDAEWLAAFPEEKKKAAVWKVCLSWSVLEQIKSWHRLPADFTKLT